MIQDSTARCKRYTDFVYYVLTRSIRPNCRRVVNVHLLRRDYKVDTRGP